MPLEYIKSNKGSDILVIDNFTFVTEKIYKGKNLWKCTEYRTAKCKSRCHTMNDIITKQPTEHNHIPDVAKVKAKIVVNDLKETASTSTEATHQLIATTSVGLSQAVAAQLPSVVNLKQIVRRVRHDHQAPLPNPRYLDELQICAPYNVTLRGDNFLLHDSGPGLEQVVLFSTARNLEYLSQSRNWFADGTFKSAPPLFQQLYTIHVLKCNKVIPMVYVLSNEKSTNSYIHVLTELKHLQSRLNPSTIMVDFEQAALLAFQTIFPDAVQQGCFFHFSQCIWRKLQQTPDLQQRYISDEHFALNIRHLAALAFVPKDDVITVFDELMDSEFYIDNSVDLREFLHYFEDTWIGRPARRGGRSAPLYPIELWNVHAQVVEDLPRTNNSVEGWHRGFSHLLSANHPTIWKFIDGLKKEQSLNELKLEQFTAGQPAAEGKKKYRDTSERIKSIVEEYGNRSNIDYLRGVAHNLNLQV